MKVADYTTKWLQEKASGRGSDGELRGNRVEGM